MSYKQDLSGCFESVIGHPGLLPKTLQSYKGQLQKSLQNLRALHDAGTLPLLKLPYLRKDLETLESIALRFQDEFTDVIVLGTGGSSLGAQTLAVLARDQGITFHFFDNIDPHTFQTHLKKVSAAHTGILVISKSGNTVETLMQFLLMLDIWREHEGEQALRDHFIVISEDKKSAIREIADTYHIPCLTHDPDLGGRFSVLSLVGLLPAMILGINPLALREGAAKVLDHTFSPRKNLEENAPLMGAFAAFALGKTHPNMVLMPYVDRLKPFSYWYRQLWAESLGKQGKGTTPITALGAVDQHSQLQLYLDGPKDKFFTLITQRDFDEEFRVNLPSPQDKVLQGLNGHSLGELLTAEAKATLATLLRNRCPTRLIEYDTLNEETLGALLMHFILETLLTAQLMNVNPFDQPAVEEGKRLAYQFLKETTRA